MRFASMHFHKHILAPRRFNCAPMHLQSQNSALNGSHLHQCLLRHSKCTQPTQIKCSTNQMCTNTPEWLKSRLTMLECAHMHIQCFQIPPKSTNQILVHLQTPNGLQNLKAPPKLFKTPPRLRKRLQNPPKVQTCTSNTHKPSRSLSMHTSNQTSNHATRMCGPITYWKTIGLEERLRNQKHIEHTSMWTMLGVRETNSPPTLLFIPFHVPRHWQTIWDNYFFPSLFKHVRGINIFQIYLCLWLLATLIYHIVSIIYIIIFNIFNNVVMQPKGTFEDAIFVVNILIFFQLNIFNAKNIPKMAF